MVEALLADLKNHLLTRHSRAGGWPTRGNPVARSAFLSDE
jgi:hypothetical protein